MKHLLLSSFLLCTFYLFAQDFPITGDWVFPHWKEGKLKTPLFFIQVEKFHQNDFVGLVFLEDAPPLLHKISQQKIQEHLYLSLHQLSETSEPHYRFFKVQQLDTDSMELLSYNSLSIKLSNRDSINNTGTMLMIDSNKITFDLVYSKSDLVYNDEEDLWESSPSPQMQLFLSQNPALFDYLIHTFGDKMDQHSIMLYRWSYFLWDKVNTLKTSTLKTVTRLDTRKVFSIFEKASIDSLLIHQVKTCPVDNIQERLKNCHLVRNNNSLFEKTPQFWIFEFENGSQIKVKTTNFKRRLYDATNQKYYDCPKG